MLLLKIIKILNITEIEFYLLNLIAFKHILDSLVSFLSAYCMLLCITWSEKRCVYQPL